MQIGKYTLTVDNRGIINVTPKADLYFSVGADVANSMAESGTTEWHEICLKIMNALHMNAPMIKSKVFQEMSSMMTTVKIGQEEGRLKSELKGFDEVRAFTNGYNMGVEQSMTFVKSLQESLHQSLNNILPSDL